MSTEDDAQLARRIIAAYDRAAQQAAERIDELEARVAELERKLKTPTLDQEPYATSMGTTDHDLVEEMLTGDEPDFGDRVRAMIEGAQERIRANEERLRKGKP